MKTLDIIAWVLIVVGAINWGLVGLFGFDLVAFITGEQFGTMNVVTRLLYILVGLAGVYEAVAIRAIRHRWVGITEPPGANI